MIEFHIMPECYIDTMLIETLVPSVNKYNHQKGCSTIENQMINRNGKIGKFYDKFALGIIDNDKRQISYLKECNIIDQSRDDIYLFKHDSKHHYFILINPGQEQWIINSSIRLGLELNNFNLPSKLEELRLISKKIVTINDKRFKNLFIEFSKSDDSTLRKLKSWLTILINDNYNVKIDDLKANR